MCNFIYSDQLMITNDFVSSLDINSSREYIAAEHKFIDLK